MAAYDEGHPDASPLNPRPLYAREDHPRLTAPTVVRETREGEAVPPIATPDSDAVQAWDEMSAMVRRLLAAKDANYGGAWRRQGYMGNLARVLSKAARLENMMWRDREEPPTVHGSEYVAQAELDNEAIADTIIDLAALVAFLHANLASENRWGRDGS